MSIIDIAPTRSNLFQLKSSLAFAREGYSILDKKREVLTIELMSLVEQAEAEREKVLGLMEEAYRKLELAQLTMGEEKVEWAALSVNKTMEVTVLSHGMMGVPLPNIEGHGSPPELSYSLSDTTVPLDETTLAFRAVLEEIPNLTSLEISVRRLAREVRKTQRRVNALERIFIPNYEETIRYIVDSLEEQDREETFRMQWLKGSKEE
jgi:V/A-type H+-transporting ATPase subunit D